MKFLRINPTLASWMDTSSVVRKRELRATFGDFCDHDDDGKRPGYK
jgi:hypothetical protein